MRYKKPQINSLLICIISCLSSTILASCNSPQIIGANPPLQATEKPETKPSITISNSNLDLPAQPTETMLIVRSQTAWKTNDTPSWLTLNVKDSTLTITTLSNTSSTSRTVTIDLFNKHSITQLTISQSANETNNPNPDPEPPQEFNTSITLTKSGTLQSLLSDAQLTATTTLSVSGPLNNSDFAIIRTYFALLQKLDIANAKTSEVGVIRGKKQLLKVIFPSDAISISNTAIKDCDALETVILPQKLTTIGIAAFENCTNLTGITFPETLEIIGATAFANCTSLTKIVLSEKITTIGDAAFENCENLTNIICFAISPPQITTSQFKGISPSAKLFVPQNSIELYKKAVGWSIFSNNTFAIE